MNNIPSQTKNKIPFKDEIPDGHGRPKSLRHQFEKRVKELEIILDRVTELDNDRGLIILVGNTLNLNRQILTKLSA